MRTSRWILAILALLTLAPAALGTQRGRDELRRDMEFARQQVYPALVNISVVVKGYGGGRSQRFPAAGSGVIVGPAGHVVTNYHVAGDATRIICRLPTKEAIEAEVVAHDPLTDLSVLKLKLNTRKDRNAPIPFARIGDSSKLETGDYVLAMGNPMTLSSSMTLGIVGNPRRVFSSFTGAEIEELDLGEGQITGVFTRWVQHDALILPGNSGGPLVNLDGEVVGINELGGGGVGFAIPSNLVAHVLNQALSHGEVIRGWFGVTIYPVEKMGREGGVLVSSIQPGGPAEKAGLKPGDVLVALGDGPVDAVHFEEIPTLYKRFADHSPGAKVPVFYERGGQTLETTLEVARMEKYLADVQEVRKVGLTVRDITGPMALMRRYPSTDGVLVTGTRPGYAADAAKPKVRPGDIILEIDGKPVRDYETFRELVANLGERDDILVRLRRDDEHVVTVFDTEARRKPFSGGELPKAWLGVRTQVLTPDVAKAVGLDRTKGYRVTQVYGGTEAEKAGLRVGDVVTALNGKALPAYRMQDSELMSRRIENLPVDGAVRLTVIRDGAEKEIEVKLQETPQTASEVKSAEDDLLEYTVRGIVFADLVKNRWPSDQTGVLVTEVTSGGWAYLAGLRAGDLIREIDGRKITSISDFKSVVKAIRKERVSPVSIFVVRGYRTAFVFAQPEY